MSKKKIPNGWTDYLPYGDKVEGTKLFPFKTPLKLELQSSIPKFDRFTPACLMANMPNLRAVIDLTDTATSDRYYCPQDFLDGKVDHLKIRISGGGLVPGMDKIREFSNAVDGFLKKYADDPDALIGVHCTHGLNRTGYFVCMYMVKTMGCDPSDAIDRFQKARGYEINRQNFLDEIMQPGKNSRSPQKPNYERESKSVRQVGSYSYKNDWLEVSGKRPFRGFTESEAKYRGLKRYNRGRRWRESHRGREHLGLHKDTISRLEMMHMSGPSEQPMRTHFAPRRDHISTPELGREIGGPVPMEWDPSWFVPGWREYKEGMNIPTYASHLPPRANDEVNIGVYPTLSSTRYEDARSSYPQHILEVQRESNSWRGECSRWNVDVKTREENLTGRGRNLSAGSQRRGFGRSRFTRRGGRTKM